MREKVPKKYNLEKKRAFTATCAIIPRFRRAPAPTSPRFWRFYWDLWARQRRSRAILRRSHPAHGVLTTRLLCVSRLHGDNRVDCFHKMNPLSRTSRSDEEAVTDISDEIDTATGTRRPAACSDAGINILWYLCVFNSSIIPKINSGSFLLCSLTMIGTFDEWFLFSNAVAPSCEYGLL
jgi:hypothetical protein